jgi:hypothetical protein
MYAAVNTVAPFDAAPPPPKMIHEPETVGVIDAGLGLLLVPDPVAYVAVIGDIAAPRNTCIT